MRTWRLLFAVGLLAALLVPANGASALPHETGTTPHTICAVNGTVTLSGHNDNGGGGLDNNPSDGHYEFNQTELDCEGDSGGVYAVKAEGDTTDIEHSGKKDGGGEDCEQGGSVQDNTSGELHTGVITATGPSDFEGGVHFARLGTTVIADGPLTDQATGEEHFFEAELEFVPTEGDCTDKDNPVTEASLTGVAEIYDTNAVGYFHDCSLDAKPSDPHC